MSRKRTKPAPNIYEATRQASRVLVDLQRDLMDAGLFATAQAVNRASQELGFEAARLVEREQREERKRERSAR